MGEMPMSFFRWGEKGMDYSKLHWQSDFMRSEIYGECDEEDDFVVGVYTIADFPEVVVYVDTERGIIIDSYVVNEDE